jgi:hypothetical protein
MGATVRLRFVALTLPDGWIELKRVGAWKLRHVDRRGELGLSLFPVASGVTMDLPTLLALFAERRQKREESNVSGRELRKEHPEVQRVVPSFHFTFLDESSWSAGPSFCVTSTLRIDTGMGPLRAFDAVWPNPHPTIFSSEWTVSDGTYVVEASFRDFTEDAFRLGVRDCDSMMRTLRFEGPS